MHNSQLKEYRNPFGAVKTGTKVKLCLSVSGCGEPEKVMIRCWSQDEESFVLMTKTDFCGTEYKYSAELEMSDVPELFWYYFIVFADGKKYYYSNNSGFGGFGKTTEYPTLKSFQITVYDKNFKTPEWFYDSVMYQIFPDRFYRDRSVPVVKKREEYVIHEDWNEPLLNIPHPFENGPALCDFFGGNLRGIEEKLDYLKNLGISVIYLNPIFESYSNHRYDTGNYKKIDPLLGDENDFSALCAKAEKKGIRIILDGVFSHTGSDSIYFNKYHRYAGDEGAYSNPNSPYRAWFQWEGEHSYKSWWGCSNLPNVCEMNESYLDYILRDKDAVIKRWLRLGASGWRLDVADELPDEFIKILRREAKKEKSDAVIIGEVWEDASNKTSYGKMREYLLGDELDSVMNYPFKDLFIDFILCKKDAKELNRGIMGIMENYPKEVLYSLMNMASTHDTMRIKTVLGQPDLRENMSFEEKQNYRLPYEKEALSIKRTMVMAFLQMTFVGVPCIYYGDEIGMQGLSDPFNRMPFNRRCVDTEMLSYYEKLGKMRNSFAALRRGELKPVYAEDGIYVYLREINNSKDVFGKKEKNSKIICIVNRSGFEESFKTEIPGIKKEYISYINKVTVTSDGKTLSMRVPPYFADILTD